MFLSLARPDRILSPITTRAATSLGAGALAVVIIAWRYATEDGQNRNFLRCPPLPCHGILCLHGNLKVESGLRFPTVHKFAPRVIPRTASILRRRHKLAPPP